MINLVAGAIIVQVIMIVWYLETRTGKKDFEPKILVGLFITFLLLVFAIAI